jgi:hypothetical protein
MDKCGNLGDGFPVEALQKWCAVQCSEVAAHTTGGQHIIYISTKGRPGLRLKAPLTKLTSGPTTCSGPGRVFTGGNDGLTLGNNGAVLRGYGCTAGEAMAPCFQHCDGGRQALQ